MFKRDTEIEIKCKNGVITGFFKKIKSGFLYVKIDNDLIGLNLNEVVKFKKYKPSKNGNDSNE